MGLHPESTVLTNRYEQCPVWDNRSAPVAVTSDGCAWHAWMHARRV